MGIFLPSVLIVAAMAQTSTAFTLYPPVDASKLATALNLTTTCLAALNESLPDCDQTLFSMTGQFDNYYWQNDDIATLCNSNCSTAAQNWNFHVEDACVGQTITAYGRLLPADSISGRFVDGLSHVCLSSSQYDSWCLPLSYSWTGSDYIRVDCDANPSDPSCSTDNNSTASVNVRLADLYTDDILCDNCFSDMLYARVSSPYYPDTDQLLYLSDQLQDIGDVCNKTVPPITIRADPSYAPAPPATSVYLGISTSTVSSASDTPTCQGQLIKPAQKIRGMVARQANGGCDSLSQQYGVTTGDLQLATGSDTCAISSSICLPLNCTVAPVASGQTCDTLAASVGGNSTVTQFLRWNPNILGLCDAPTPGQYVCMGAPGGTFKLAPPPLGDNANAGNQQRGGQSGVVTPSATVTAPPAGVATTRSGPSPTQSGIASNCNSYAKAESGDTCFQFAQNHNISPDQLYQWNAVLGSGGANCAQQFQAAEYYCIGTTDGPATTTAIQPTSPAAPGPTQSGIAPGCNKYATPATGQGCYDFAAANSITASQLYAWNNVLGDNGAACGSNFQFGTYYCVGVSDSADAPPPAAGPAAPGPTQPGQPSNCNGWDTPADGQGCYDFAQAHSISLDQLCQLNPVLGGGGSNCGSQFQKGEYYCLSTSA